MKRLSLLVAVLTMAGLWLGPVSPAAHAGGSVALTPVANPLACQTAAAAHPSFASIADAEAFVTTGPCAPASTATAATPTAGTMTCGITVAPDGSEPPTFGLVNWLSTTFSFGCTHSPATLICINVTAIPDGIPTVVTIAGAGTDFCEAFNTLQYTPALLHEVAHQFGIVVGVTASGFVGVQTGSATWTT